MEKLNRNMKSENKKVEYVNPDTFTIKINEFETFHYDIAKEISDFLSKKYKKTKTDITDIISNEQGDELIMGIIKERLMEESVAEKYKITIKKV
jgi:hypothetical protein